MKMTDETLSAFLDNELTQPQMEAVREALIADPTLSDRLAEFATVDDELQKHYSSIDARPMPQEILHLLDDQPSEDKANDRNNVIEFPWWRQVKAHSRKAIAAAVVAGVALFQWTNVSTDGEPGWPAVAAVLDSQASGEAYSLEANATLTPRLTFQNQSGQWCRQFRVDWETSSSEQIACRDNSGSWTQVASQAAEPVADSERYQAASGGSIMDDELDRMMAGPPVSPETEQQLLKQQWSD